MMDYEPEHFMNNSEELKHLLDKMKLDLDPGWEDYYQLNKALMNGQKEAAMFLLQNGARVNKDSLYFGIYTPLHHAVQLGCPEIIRLLLDKGARTNVTNSNYETPLIMAAKMEKYLIADYLLSVDGLKNCSNRENLNHMHIACMRNRVDIVKRLLQTGENINQAVKSNSMHWPGFTPLHFAVQFQCVETIEFLLFCGANITAKDAKLMTPLHYANILRNNVIIDLILSMHQYEFCNPVNSEGLSHFHIACTRNNPLIIEFFLKHGVDVNMEVPRQSLNWAAYRPINFAIDYECIDVIKLLLLHKACLNYCDNHDRIQKPIQHAYRTANKEIMDLLWTNRTFREVHITTRKQKIPDFDFACMKKGREKIISKTIITEKFNEIIEDLNIRICIGFTPLHFAIKIKSKITAEILLQHGASITVKDSKGKTPLHLAFENKLMSIVDMILFTHLHIKENPTNNEGFSHFHISCMRDNLQIIANFLKNGVDVNESVNNNSVFWPGYTALHFATALKLKNVVELLLQNGADVTVKNGIGLTPLDIAILCTDSKNVLENKSGGFEIVQLILSKSFFHNIDSFNDRGFSLLHIACISDNKDAIESILNILPEMINKPINWEECDWFGYTPLHFAVYFASTESVKLLINRGANISIQNEEGDTALHVAFNLVKCYCYDIENPELFFTDKNFIGEEGMSHFHIACNSGNLEAVQYFLDRGVDINKPTKFTNSYDYNCHSPLHLAVNNEEVCEKIVQLLIDHGANINARDAELNTPLHFTKDNVTLGTAKILLIQGADINAQNIYGETPLYSLCCYCEFIMDDQIRPKKIQFFLDNGADINIEDEEGESPFSSFIVWMKSNDDYYKSISLMMKHIKKLKTINAYISKKNEQNYLAMLKKCETETDYKEADFTQECLEELQKLEKLNVDKYTTLRSILKKNLNLLALHSKNETLQNIINSNDFTEKFPIYGYLLKLHFEKGVKRRPLLEISKISLNLLINFPISDACLLNILQFLSNEDLKNIVLSIKQV